MDPYGYVLKGNSKTAPADYIPSLIGTDTGNVSPTKADPYFERIDLPNRCFTSISFSRWVNYDSLPLPTQDPILEVRSPGFSFYIPYTELYELAAFHHDDDTIEMLDALKIGERQ